MVKLYTWIAALVAVITEAVNGRVRKPARAVTLLEYVMLAALVVVAIGTLAVIFNDQVSSLVSRIRTAMGG